MRITVNLATRPFADLGPAIKRLRIGMGVLALLAILLGVGLHEIHQNAEAARARDHSLDGQIARISQERQRYQDLMRQPPNAKLLQQAAVLNRLFDEKAFSWTLAMEDLETVLPGGVQVTTLEPARQKDGHISLKLRIVGPRDRSVDLVRNLEHSRRFLNPRIVGENAESTDRPGQRPEPVSASDREDFDLLADYSPASPEDRRMIRKPAAKNEDSEKLSRPEPRSVRPLLLPGVGQGRPPYTGSIYPPTRVPAAPGQVNQVPMRPGPANPASTNPASTNPGTVSPVIPAGDGRFLPRPPAPQPNPHPGGPQ